MKNFPGYLHAISDINGFPMIMCQRCDWKCILGGGEEITQPRADTAYTNHVFDKHPEGVDAELVADILVERGIDPADVQLGAWHMVDAVSDPVEHPAHYNSSPSGIECITVVEHMSFLRGNAVKYLWRAGDKGDTLEDLRKARWYIDREITRLEGAAK